MLISGAYEQDILLVPLIKMLVHVIYIAHTQDTFGPVH